MKRASSGPILVLFARTPASGQIAQPSGAVFDPRPRLAAALGDEKARALERAFLLDSIDLLHRVSPHGVRPAIAWEGGAGVEDDSLADVLGGVEILSQQGEDPGQRMSGTLADLFARGHDSVGILGTGTPSLPLEHLLKAFDWLRDRDVVLGPSAQGGYYFLGARAVVPEIFRGIPWGTDRVLEETLKILKILGLPRVTLPVWRSVEGPEDIEEIRRGLTGLRETDPTARQTRRLLAIN